MSKRKTKGSNRWAFGAVFAIPNPEANSVTSLTFKGSFDRRKLRRMLRTSLVAKGVTVEALDYMIDNYSVKLKPLDMNELLVAMEAGNAEATPS